MSDQPTKRDEDAEVEVRPTYHFSKSVRGKYAAQYREGSNVVLLEPDMAAVFKTSKAVNEALREIARLRRSGGH